MGALENILAQFYGNPDLQFSGLQSYLGNQATRGIAPDAAGQGALYNVMSQLPWHVLTAPTPKVGSMSPVPDATMARSAATPLADRVSGLLEPMTRTAQFMSGNSPRAWDPINGPNNSRNFAARGGPTDAYQRAMYDQQRAWQGDSVPKTMQEFRAITDKAEQDAAARAAQLADPSQQMALRAQAQADQGARAAVAQNSPGWNQKPMHPSDYSAWAGILSGTGLPAKTYPNDAARQAATSAWNTASPTDRLGMSNPAYEGQYFTKQDYLNKSKTPSGRGW